MQKDGIIVDNFCGGGGVSKGLEEAGLVVNYAINHDPDAITMYKINHPNTVVFNENIWEVDPREVAKGRTVHLAWFSPDCTYFSKARGGKPRSKKIRSLAWVTLRWAATVKPEVIILENVVEFQEWGPLTIEDKPDPKQKGSTFNSFVNALRKQGYKVEYQALIACYYGAPTSRKRFIMIARCDGKPIVWPEATHGDPDSLEVRCGLLKPWRTAAECIDFSRPCPSIFSRKKQLADNTRRRIAKGLDKFVLKNSKPFIMVNNQNNIGGEINEPLKTVTTGNRHFLVQFNNNCDGKNVNEPIPTIVAGQGHWGEARTFLTTYYGNEGDIGQNISEPLRTITAKDRFGLISVTVVKIINGRFGYWPEVRELLNKYCNYNLADDELLILNIDGRQYFIYDLGMRMLEPRELYNAQGFAPDYIIDFKKPNGKPYSKAAQIARCGNAVPPPFATALARANLPELCAGHDRQEVINQ